MKKLFLITGLFFSAFQSGNCQEDSSIAGKISVFNVQSHRETLTTGAQRSWWQSVLNVITVVAADIGGGYAGVVGTAHVAGVLGIGTGGVGTAVVAGVAGVIGAAGASNGAYQGLRREINGTIGYGNLNINLPNNYMHFSLIGKQHNEVIHTYFVSPEPLVNFYSDKLNEEERKIIESNEMQTIFSSLNDLGLKSTEENKSFAELTSELEERGLMTSIGREILSAFFEKYKNCASPKDMENLINFSIEKVTASSLVESEKECLLVAFMIASESPFYQNPKNE